MGRRERVRAAVHKMQQASAGARVDEADEIGAGVRSIAKEIAAAIVPGSLYWAAPFQFVCEQMAPRVCRQHSVDLERADDVAAYLLAGMNEYIVQLVGAFDIEHFEAWTAAQAAQEVRTD